MASPAKQATTTYQPPAAREHAEAALLDKILEQQVDVLDRTAIRYQRELDSAALTNMRRAMITARALAELKKLFTPGIRKELMALMNSPLGFRTDRGPNQSRADKKQPYPEDVVVDCALEALLHGVMWTGNEFNIIADRCYITKEGYQRKLRETEGLSDLVLSPGVPVHHNGQTCVRMGASWKYEGKPDQLRGGDGAAGRVIPVPTNQYSGPDQIIGKATRKALKAVYEQIHGSEHTLPDGEVDDTPSGQAAPSQTAVLEGKASAVERLADLLEKQAPPAEAIRPPLNGEDLEREGERLRAVEATAKGGTSAEDF